MRLLSVGSLPPELGGAARGGVATFHAALLEGLLERRGEVEIAAVLAPDPPSAEAPFPILVRPEGTTIADFYAGAVLRLEPDVVLLNHVANTVGVTHARLEGAPPAVGVVHSWHNVTFCSAEQRPRARAVTAEALGGLAAMVAPSHHSHAEGERLGLPYPPMTRTIHYPLQPLYLRDDLAVVPGGEREGVLYVGSLIHRKGPERLVEAAASLPRMRLTLVGEGAEEERLRKLIGRLGLERRVRIDPMLGPDHLLRLRDRFRRAAVLCLPSGSESFGIVFIEALACGTPVVGFGPTVREIREAMGVEVGVPLDDASPAAIAAAIERVLATEWDREALRRAAVASFSLARAGESYLEVLRRCAAESGVLDGGP